MLTLEPSTLAIGYEFPPSRQASESCFQLFLGSEPFWIWANPGFNSVISPLEIKTGHWAANDAQKNLLFPRPTVASERREKTYSLSQDLHLLPPTCKLGTEQGWEGSISLPGSSPEWHLQEVRTFGRNSCWDVPSQSLKARVPLSHWYWLQQEPK